MALSASLDLTQDVRASSRVQVSLSPQALMGLELLALPLASLETRVKEEIDNNPFLELDFAASDCQFDDIEALEQTISDWQDADDEPSYWNGCFEGHTAGITHFEWDFERLIASTNEVETLETYLITQLRDRPLPEQTRQCAECLVEYLDKRGFLPDALEYFEKEWTYDRETLIAALAEIQQLQPRGIGAQSLQECLLLQLQNTHPRYEVMRHIIEESLDDIAANRKTRVVRKYHLKDDEYFEIRNYIAGLSFCPADSYTTKSHADYVVADVEFLATERGFKALVHGNIAGSVYVSHNYDDVIDTLSPDDQRWMQDRREKAVQFVSMLASRATTLQKVATYLLEAQFAFLKYGMAHMRPLTMQEVADCLGVHVSTVSRAVQDKYARTPWGTYPLRQFFSSSVAADSEMLEAQISSVTAKSFIADMIAHEDKRHPLSDASIADALQERGVCISRRTVAKYRDALGIAPLARRKA